MLTRAILACGLLLLLLICGGFTDKKLPEPTASDPVEWPVILRQKLTAGTTPVGTKVQAKLTISTLVHGTVVPRNAVISGEITESVAKSANTPSKLGIRMDMARWKNGSLAIKAYLTEWYVKMERSSDAPGDSVYHGSLAPAANPASLPSSPMGGGTIAPVNNPPSIPPAPDPAPLPSAIDSYARSHRLRMRDVESQRSADGSTVITSKSSNLKLGNHTTYVFAGDDRVSRK